MTGVVTVQASAGRASAHPRNAASSGEVAVVWDEDDGAGGRDIVFVRLSAIGAMPSVPVILGKGTEPIITVAGTGDLVVWQSGAQVLQCRVTGGVGEAAVPLFESIPTSGLRAVAAGSSQAIAYYDTGLTRARLAICP